MLLRALVLLGLGPQPAASPPDALGDALTLEWSAPAGCPDVTQVRERVALSIPPKQAPSRRVGADGGVERSEDGRWHLHLQIATGEGTITPAAEADDCETLTDAAVVHLVMALEPRPEGDEPAAPTIEPPAPVVPPTPPPAAPPPAEPRVRGAFGGGGGVGFGLLPRFDGWLVLNGAVLVRLRGSRIRSRARAEIIVGHALSQTRRVSDSDAGVRVSGWSVAPRGCWEPVVRGRRPLAGFSFPLCGGVDLAAVVGRGEGVEQSGRAARFWLAVSAGASAQWEPLRRLGLRLAVEGFVTAVRPSFTLDNGDPIYTVGRGGVRSLLLVQVTLP